MTSAASAVARTAGTPTEAQLPLLFQPLVLRGLTLRNRIAVAPMCQYSCEGTAGLATDWHLVHLGARAVGGAGLILTEAAAVSPEGRISPHDLGIWSDAHAEALARTVAFVKSQGAAIGLQLAHAGRKAGTIRPWERQPHSPPQDPRYGWVPVGASPLPFADQYDTPIELDAAGIARVIQAFVDATRRCDQVGFDVVELHAAHGYLLHSFLSPISNVRTDRYGGSFEHRARLLLELTEAVRAVWPPHKPLLVRISATDWIEGGWGLEDSVRLAGELRARGVDLIDCSSGGTSPSQQIFVHAGYQVPFAERIRKEANIPTGAVGLITSGQAAERILVDGQADLVIIGREFLRDPYFPLRAATALGVPEAAPWPMQYARSR